MSRRIVHIVRSRTEPRVCRSRIDTSLVLLMVAPIALPIALMVRVHVPQAELPGSGLE